MEVIDVAPTVLALAKRKTPDSFRGRSLAPVVLGGEPAGGHAAFAELEDRVVSVRTDRFRYVHNPSDFDFPLSPDDPAALYPIDREELYELARDPGERHNVAGVRAAELEPLRGTVRRWQDRHGWTEASRSLRGREVPEELREVLDALGYVP